MKLRYKGFFGLVKMVVHFIRHPKQWRNLVGQLKARKEATRRIMNDEPYDDLIGVEDTAYNRALRDYAEKLKDKKKSGELIELN